MNQPNFSQENRQTNSGKSEHLRNDPALKAFLSKEVKNDSPAFKDYPPTTALVQAGIDDFITNILGIK
jgi:hypothetical protein